MTATPEAGTPATPGVCTGCGCTDERPCEPTAERPPCAWVDEDTRTLCTRCLPAHNPAGALAVTRFICPVCAQRGGTVEAGCYGCAGAGTIAVASDRPDGLIDRDELKAAFAKLREQATDATRQLVDDVNKARLTDDEPAVAAAHTAYGARLGEHATGTLPAINAAELIYLPHDLAQLPPPATRLVAVRHDLRSGYASNN